MMDSPHTTIFNQRAEPAQGILYLVGTPIGNLGDLSPRAISLLKEVSVIACEDTRHSGMLLKKLDIHSKLISFHKHNSKSRTQEIIELLESKSTVALISDAGMPGISDPGEDLVKEVKEIGKDVICIPGPCAALTALVSSGLSTRRFCFEGFLPYKGKERNNRLISIVKESRTSIIYESPHRIRKLLKELLDLCGKDRPLQVARELTKIHEQQIGSTIGDVYKYFETNKPIGEFTIILGGDTNKINIEYSKKELIDLMMEMINSGSSVNEAAKDIAKRTGQPKSFLYSLLH